MRALCKGGSGKTMGWCPHNGYEHLVCMVVRASTWLLVLPSGITFSTATYSLKVHHVDLCENLPTSPS